MKQLYINLFICICIALTISIVAKNYIIPIKNKNKVKIVKPLRISKKVMISDYAKKYGKKYKVKPRLILAVIKVESNNGRYNKSKSDACGIMQIRPSTASYIIKKHISCNELMSSNRLSIKIGTIYIKKMLSEFNNIKYAIAAYNAGPTRVYHWFHHLGYIPSSTNPTNNTLAYVNKVYNIYKLS